MKKILIFILLLSGILAGNDSSVNRRNKILSERFEKEKGELTYNLRVTQQEQLYLENSYINTLIKKKKVEFLIKSSDFMKENCIPFDSRCRNVYNMSIAYLEDEKIKLEEELEEQEKILTDTGARIESLNEQLQYIDEGVILEKRPLSATVSIPELAKAFKCNELRGWNTYRGVFVKPEDVRDLPFKMFVKDVAKLHSGSYFIELEAGDHTVNFAYAKEPLVKKGEITGMGNPFFSKSQGNPVMPGKVLISVTKNNKFVNPRFMCK